MEHEGQETPSIPRSRTLPTKIRSWISNTYRDLVFFWGPKPLQILEMLNKKAGHVKTGVRTPLKMLEMLSTLKKVYSQTFPACLCSTQALHKTPCLKTRTSVHSLPSCDSRLRISSKRKEPSKKRPISKKSWDVAQRRLDGKNVSSSFSLQRESAHACQWSKARSLHL